MTAMEDKDSLQLNHQVLMNCPTNIRFPSNQKYNGTEVPDLHEVKDTINGHPTPDTIDKKCSITGEYAMTSEENHNEPIHQYGFSALPAFYPVSADVKLSNPKALRGQFYSYYADNRFHYAPINIIPQNHCNNGYKFQDFQYFVVIDFEATCDKVKIPNPQEIIEFPSVIVNGMTSQVEACFQTYVRPTCNRMLSDFCKDLTGIQQIQVDRGVTLSEALLRHDKWLENKGVKDTNFAVVTWSDWDCRVMLESECHYKKIRKPSYFNRWINLKVPFREVFAGARCNLKEAVEMAGLSWQGRPHCGLDDAKNTAFLLAKLMTKGFKFSITDSLVCESTSFKQPIEYAFTHYPALRVMAMRIPALQLEPLCYCGVKSSKGMFRKPGPMNGCIFLGCGNWTAVTGARCRYFQWVSP